MVHVSDLQISEARFKQTDQVLNCHFKSSMHQEKGIGFWLSRSRFIVDWTRSVNWEGNGSRAILGYLIHAMVESGHLDCRVEGTCYK